MQWSCTYLLKNHCLLTWSILLRWNCTHICWLINTVWMILWMILFLCFIQYVWYGLVHHVQRINTFSIDLYTCSYWISTFVINVYIYFSDNQYLLRLFLHFFIDSIFLLWDWTYLWNKTYLIALYICSYVFNTVAVDLYVFANKSLLLVWIYIYLLIHSIFLLWDYTYIRSIISTCCIDL